MKWILFNLNYTKQWCVLNKKNNYLLLISKTLIFLNINNLLKINKNINVIKLNAITIKNITNLNKINMFLMLENYFLIKKIKFNGKGFKIKKLKKKINMLFNKSHKIQIIPNKSIIKKITKNQITIISKKININFLKKLIRVFNFNIFTKKGLRLSKQLLIVKKK